MCLIFVVCYLICSINLPLEAKPVDDPKELSSLKEQRAFKNAIESFEVQWTLHFKPNMDKVDSKAPASRQNVEIRRQRWEYIFEKLVNSYIIKHLRSEVEKAGIDRATFCQDIAEAYSALTKDPFTKPADSPVPADDILRQKSVQIFMKSISDLNLNPQNGNEETVKIPKSLYIELLQNDARAALAGDHKLRLQRLKDKYRDKVREAIGEDDYEIRKRMNSEILSHEYY